MPDLKQRVDHICRHQLFGIAITEITGYLSRRSLYCSKKANSRHSVSTLDTPEGHIRYVPVGHTWENGKCIYCGVSQGTELGDERRGKILESHAYEFIHTLEPGEIFNMKFDVIISNPPYQLSDGGNNASAIPIYQKFVEKAIDLSPKFVIMIIPSRWFSGGRGLEDFRKRMLNDECISEIYDFSDANDCFPGVDISGGICYFKWDKYHAGSCRISNISKYDMNVCMRKLNEFPILVRSNRGANILRKVLSSPNFVNIQKGVSCQRPFGLRTFVRPDDKGELVLRWNGGKGPINESRVIVGLDLIDKWKVIVSRVFYEHGGNADKQGKNRVLSVLEILKPNEVCSETYIIVRAFDSKREAEYFELFLRQKFIRFLILQASSSIMISRNSFAFVPELDFNIKWMDEDLYRKYRISEEEKLFIDNTIHTMD